MKISHIYSIWSSGIQWDLDAINERVESGEIIEQKTWKFIRELNSYSEASLDSIAIVDGKKEYTYRQMFRLLLS